MRILIIDDHSLFREGLKFLLHGLDSGLELDKAGDCAEAFSLLDKHRYDLILLDLKLPDRNGLDVLSEIRKSYANSPVVVLSGEDSPRIVNTAIDGGAMGFIPKASTPEMLIEALRRVLEGGIYLPPSSLTKGSAQAEGEPGDSDPGVLQTLTPRQTDVLRYLIRGEPNKVIAQEMSVSLETVKSHISAVLSILGARNRTEAVYFAARHGMKIN
jgi:DNA-binding NarL/FixJ family response regulator